MNYKSTFALLFIIITPFLLTAQWTNVPGTLAKISCASHTQIAGLDNSDNVYKYNASNTFWDTLPSSALVEISINSEGSIWGIGPAINPENNSNVYSYKNNTWALPNNGANLLSLSMASDSFGYGINPNMNNNIYEYRGVNWTVLPGNGALINVSIGKDSSLWGVGPTINPAGNSNVYRYDRAKQIWTIPNNGADLAKIAVADSLRIIGIDNNGLLYKRTNNTWNVVSSISNVKDISIAFDGTIYCLTDTSSGNIYKSTWALVNPTVGLNESENLDKISIYPNPSNSFIHLSHADYNIESIELYNIHGSRISLNTEGYSNIDISTYPDGVYFIKITTVLGQRKVVKFSKI